MTGKKTSNSLQSGLVWVPYIPIETVQSISNSNFTPRLSIKSRYFIRTINLLITLKNLIVKLQKNKC